MNLKCLLALLLITGCTSITPNVLSGQELELNNFNASYWRLSSTNFCSSSSETIVFSLNETIVTILAVSKHSKPACTASESCSASCVSTGFKPGIVSGDYMPSGCKVLSGSFGSPYYCEPDGCSFSCVQQFRFNVLTDKLSNCLANSSDCSLVHGVDVRFINNLNNETPSI